ncbi:response regulator [Candidatus Bathyarchaeota archaeon]|nr:response regulator [Candidatus Bathyarchaeota archaeon]
MTRVLIADDTSFMRMVLKNIMAKMGNEVVAEAANGDEALEQYIRHRPGLVLLDIVMPSGEKTRDGIDALRMIRQEDPTVNVVMISSMGQETIKEEVKTLGACGFIVKPFKTDQVMEVLSRYC